MPESAKNKDKPRVSWVSGTDVGTYAYCGRLYWLTKVEGKKSDMAAEQRLADGHDHHQTHAAGVSKAIMARKYVIDAMMYSAIGLLAMWLVVRFGLSVMSAWIDLSLSITVVLLAAGLSYIIRGRKLLRKSNLPDVKIITTEEGDLESKTLRDRLTGLYGRPDYILEEEGKIVPVELKPTRTVAKLYESDEMQLVHYLMLIEQLEPDRFAGFGRVVYAKKAFKVDLDNKRRAALLGLVSKIRAAREAPGVDRTHNIVGRCLGCAVRNQCDQAMVSRGGGQKKHIEENAPGKSHIVGGENKS